MHMDMHEDIICISIRARGIHVTADNAPAQREVGEGHLPREVQKRGPHGRRNGLVVVVAIGRCEQRVVLLQQVHDLHV